jgi:hypothetical protein
MPPPKANFRYTSLTLSGGGLRTVDPSPAPTIDERANFYLNAVYGAREFKGEEYARARRIILGAMTIDVGAATLALASGSWKTKVRL